MTDNQATVSRIPPVDAPSPEVVTTYGKALTVDGEVLNIFKVLAWHPRLLKRWNLLGGLFLTDGMLPAREREIVILRVGWRTRSVYEFGQHTVIGAAAGLTDGEISLLARPLDGDAWSADDYALVAMADELCAHDRVGEAVWAALAARWNEAQLVELVMLAGFYRMVSGFLNSVGVQREPGVPGWPGEPVAGSLTGGGA